MSTLQVNEITDTGGSTLLGRRNAIINGNFDVWQRGTSQTASGYGSADRWGFDAGTSTFTMSQASFTLGQTDVPNEPKHYASTAVTTGSTAGSFALYYQQIESVRTLAGQTATLSFWAKADAAKDIAVELSQSFGSGGSPSAQVNGIGVTTCSLTTSWQKFEVTVAIPSISGKALGTNSDDKLTLLFWLDAGSDFNARTNSLGNQSGTFDIAQVQLEAGSVATPFERRSYGEELALCQRYCQTVRESAANGRAASSNNSITCAYFNTYMRFTPTVSYTTTLGTVSAVYAKNNMVTFNGTSDSSNRIAVQDVLLDSEL